MLREIINNEIIDYIYLENDLIGFIYKNKVYYYLKNILGDIIQIYDVNNNLVAKYNYDSYGNCIIETNVNDIANINPFRYRGYYYDKEVNLYYCLKRYYSPMLCRWISQDDVEYLDFENINGLNLYAYCLNDPINNVDPSGEFALSIGLLFAIGGIVGSVIGAGVSVVGQYLTNDCSLNNFSWGQLALDTVLGGVSGMLSMSSFGKIGMIVANGGLGFVGAVGGHLINESDFSKESTMLDIILSTLLSGFVGVVGGAGGLNSGYLNSKPKTTGFIRALGTYNNVLTKSVVVFYKTPGIASNALRLSSRNLVKQWNKMVVEQASEALEKSLIYGAKFSLIGNTTKALLYDWYKKYF